MGCGGRGEGVLVKTGEIIMTHNLNLIPYPLSQKPTASLFIESNKQGTPSIFYFYILF